MKGKACSWRDMRKIRAILSKKEKLKGEYEALMNCSSEGTGTRWDRVIDLMEAVEKNITVFFHMQPTHAVEIARGASRDKWLQWVQSCEDGKWTVKELRARLKASHFNGDHTMTSEGIYDVIVIDPPWPMAKIERVVRPNQVHFDYPVLSIDEIRDYQLEDKRTLPGLCGEHAHCFLWTTQKFLPDAFQLLTDWQLDYVCTFVWHKPGGFQPVGLPQYNCEFALYAKHGKPTFIDTKEFPTCFEAPRAEHSRKPELFYETIRRVTFGRRADVFSREFHEGFEGIGNEVGKFA